MFEDILEKEDWTRGERVLLSIIMTLNSLADQGILTNGPFIIIDMEKAKEIVGDIKPTQDEIEEIIEWLKIEGYMS
jgi:hypothetical protein